GWLRVLGQRAGASDVDFGVSLVILGDVLFFMMLVWSTAGLLRRADVHRQQTQTALAGERTLLRGLIDNLPDHIFIKDAEGRYITDNISHAQFVGLSSPEQVVGKTVADFFPPEVAAKFAADDAAVVNSARPLVSRVEVITEHDGSRRWVATTKVPVRDAAGGVTGLVCISRDITDQVRADELLREQNVKLQDLARSERDAHETLKRAQSQMVQSEKLAGLGQLVAGVAHEINNPLSFVNNNVAVLQRDVGAIAKLLKMYRQADPLVQAGNAELMSEIRDLCDAIDIDYTLTSIDELTMRSREGLKRIQQIVKDLRDFARLDESDLHEVDLNHGVESTVNIIRGRAKSKQVLLELDLHPLPPVACFPAKVNQVIMNLLANAIDACRDGGKVTISTHALDNGDGVRVEVADTGSGIPPDVRERIFDPFFTTKKQGEGTGLGLSISYGIIQDHGGTIEVESKEGEGSRFTVTLPLHASIPSRRNKSG
ncbi:MAG TPA: ATP-binding protein, partial [Tepidisphaeraceae bacterium]|nr:ATP-binding protein [Tepidisphaeraceae bacterium]